jgi:hypothetical protein
MEFHESHDIMYIQGGAVAVCRRCNCGDQHLYRKCAADMVDPHYIPLEELIVESDQLINGEYHIEGEGAAIYHRDIDRAEGKVEKPKHFTEEEYLDFIQEGKEMIEKYEVRREGKKIIMKAYPYKIGEKK